MVFVFLEGYASRAPSYTTRLDANFDGRPRSQVTGRVTRVRVGAPTARLVLSRQIRRYERHALATIR